MAQFKVLFQFRDKKMMHTVEAANTMDAQMAILNQIKFVEIQKEEPVNTASAGQPHSLFSTLVSSVLNITLNKIQTAIDQRKKCGCLTCIVQLEKLVEEQSEIQKVLSENNAKVQQPVFN